jgi:AcrR family transcriptional regulator
MRRDGAGDLVVEMLRLRDSTGFTCNKHTLPYVCVFSLFGTDIMARMNRDDWLVQGLGRLSALGPTGLRVEPMCEDLGKTKGSFYHHFRDYRDFADAVLDLWQALSADAMAVVETLTGDSEQNGGQTGGRLNQLAALLDHELERAMRRFAATDALAAEALALVDQDRIAHLVGRNRDELGLPPDAAVILAEVEYAAFVGAQALWTDTTDERHDRTGALIDAMVRRAAKQG